MCSSLRVPMQPKCFAKSVSVKKMQGQKGHFRYLSLSSEFSVTNCHPHRLVYADENSFPVKFGLMPLHLHFFSASVQVYFSGANQLRHLAQVRLQEPCTFTVELGDVNSVQDIGRYVAELLSQGLNTTS